MSVRGEGQQQQRRARTAAALAWGLACGWLWAGCGYHFVRAPDVAALGKIALVPFDELGPLGVSGNLMTMLTRALMESGVHLVRSPMDADAVLHGTVQAKTTPGATLSTVLVYNVDAVVHAALRDSSGHDIWTFEVPLRDNVLPPDPGSFAEPLTVETRRRVALDRVCQRAARCIAEALVARAAL